MQFGMCHFAYLAKYAIWRKKSVKTRIFITVHLAPHILGLERVCPWPEIFCVLGLGLEPSVFDSTSAQKKTQIVFCQ